MGRLHGLDVARFVAFAGMVLVNFRIAAEVVADTGWASTITNSLEGRAAALFVVLAGIGFTLGKPHWKQTLKRAVFLLVIGLANMTIFDADILHFYALYFLVAMLFLGVSRIWLIGGAFAAVGIWVALVLLFDYETGWNWQILQYSDFWTLPGFVRHSLFNGWHPVFPWVGFFLVGMWIGRLDLSRFATQIQMLIGGLGLAFIAMVASALVVAKGGPLSEIAGLSPVPPGPFYMLAASGSSTAAIGLILLLTPILSKLGIALWFARAGRQTLTLYVAHIVLGMGILEEFGLLDGNLGPDEIFSYTAIFCLICMIYAALWQKILSHGPLEWVMRRLTG